MAKKPTDNPMIAANIKTRTALEAEIEKQIDEHIVQLTQIVVHEVSFDVNFSAVFIQSPFADNEGKIVQLKVIERNLRKKYQDAGWADLFIEQKYKTTPPYDEFHHYEAGCIIRLKLFIYPPAPAPPAPPL